MNKTILNLIIAISLLFPLLVSGQPSMSEVHHKIKFTRHDPPARLPGQIEPNESCKYDSNLIFTITALRDHSFRHLFDEGTPAISVVLAWEHNTADFSSSSLKTALKNLAEDLFTHRHSADYKDLSFGNLVEERLFGELPNRLNSKIDTLMRNGFAFPLLNSYPGEHEKVRSILRKLIDFVGVHESNTKGGFGNLTWYELFYTKSHDGSSDFQSVFSVDKIAQHIQLAQGEVLPIPTYDCPAPLNLKKCCNDPNHTAYFRKCGEAGSGNCLQCGSYCCLAGVTWWGPHDLSAHTN